MVTMLRLVKKVAYFRIFDNRDAIINNTMDEQVDFMEDNEFHIKSRQLLGEPTTPSMISFLIKHKVVKNEKQALFVLLVFVVVVIALTIYLANVLLGSPSAPGYVEDRFGNQYTPQEYFKLLGEGKDPLSPNFKP
jgi:hypothetical protein